MQVSSVVIEFSDKQSGFIPDTNDDDRDYKKSISLRRMTSFVAY